MKKAFKEFFIKKRYWMVIPLWDVFVLVLLIPLRQSMEVSYIFQDMTSNSIIAAVVLCIIFFILYFFKSIKKLPVFPNKKIFISIVSAVFPILFSLLGSYFIGKGMPGFFSEVMGYGKIVGNHWYGITGIILYICAGISAYYSVKYYGAVYGYIILLGILLIASLLFFLIFLSPVSSGAFGEVGMLKYCKFIETAIADRTAGRPHQFEGNIRVPNDFFDYCKRTEAYYQTQWR